jgi:hypothetical protein
LSCIKKLSKGRKETQPPASQGRSQSLFQFLSLTKIFLIVFPSILAAFVISIPDESSIHDISRLVVQVIFFICSRVVFLYSGIIKNKNFGATF